MNQIQAVYNGKFDFLDKIKISPLSRAYTFSDSGSEFNFSDVDDNDTFTKVKIISVPTYGTLTKVGNGNTITANSTITNFDNIKYTPNANSENDDTFTFKVHDGTVFSSATYTMNISVNAAPVAVDDTDTITAGASAATGSVTTNDTDSDDSTSCLLNTSPSPRVVEESPKPSSA